jgi:hypothetical protein
VKAAEWSSISPERQEAALGGGSWADRPAY